VAAQETTTVFVGLCGGKPQQAKLAGYMQRIVIKRVAPNFFAELFSEQHCFTVPRPIRAAAGFIVQGSARSTEQPGDHKFAPPLIGPGQTASLQAIQLVEAIQDLLTKRVFTIFHTLPFYHQTPEGQAGYTTGSGCWLVRYATQAGN